MSDENYKNSEKKYMSAIRYDIRNVKGEYQFPLQHIFWKIHYYKFHLDNHKLSDEEEKVICEKIEKLQLELKEELEESQNNEKTKI